MSKQKPKLGPRSVVLTMPPPQQRQQASAPTATKRKKFSDVPGVQQTLFDKGGAR